MKKSIHLKDYLQIILMFRVYCYVHDFAISSLLYKTTQLHIWL